MIPKKIYSYGCSFTQGIGLSDINHLVHAETPSVLAYPAVLGNIFQVPVDNLGHGGWSNKLIAHTILQDLDKFKPGDLITMMWTAIDRHVVLQQPETPTDFLFNIGSWQCPEPDSEWNPEPEYAQTRAFFDHMYTEYDKLYSDLVQISAVNRVLKDRNMFHVNLMTSAACDIIMRSDLIDRITWFADYPALEFNAYDETTKCLHPNEKCHADFAHRLAKYIDTM